MTTARHQRHTAPVPEWLLSEVATGLQRLMLLALPGTPAAEIIAGTACAWADAFWCSPRDWHQAQDAPRIAAAFRLIACQLERFPTPKAVLHAMPERPQPKQLTELPITPDQRRVTRKRITDFIAGFKRPINRV